MSIKTDTFRKLHRLEKAFLLGNVWDAQSASICQNAGFTALGTSSAAVAQSLGYADGENMPFEEYLYVIKRILANTNLPLSVDLEAGYGKEAEAVFENIRVLHGLGVAGINLEDSKVTDGKRNLENEFHFADKLQKISDKIQQSKTDIFLNIRCDAFIVPSLNPLETAINRVKLYESKGIDGVFLPCIVDIGDIAAIVKQTTLPVNVMCMPGLADFGTLSELGVKRISMGNFVHAAMYKKMESLTGAILSSQNFSPLF